MLARWYLRFMALVAVAWGLVLVVEYVLVSYGLRLGWLRDYTAAQVDWLGSLPTWAHGAFAVWAVLTLVGGLCLAARVAASSWMLGVAMVAQLVLTAWAMLLAAPPVQTLTEASVWPFALLGAALGVLLWLFAWGERRRRGGLL